LRDALGLWRRLPQTADSLTQRRADLLKLRGAVSQPDLPDITANEIRVESAFGAEPTRESGAGILPPPPLFSPAIRRGRSWSKACSKCLQVPRHI
jgi:hypothetical protein